MLVNCTYCSTSFNARPTDIKRGHAKFCSRNCFAKNRKGYRKPVISNVTCACCAKAFYRRSSALANSKSRLYFCSRACKDRSQRLGGITEIMPPQYGRGNGRHDYRERALKHYGEICTKCGFADLRAIEVHHKDKNRENNELNNLVVLCANCHCIEHYQ